MKLNKVEEYYDIRIRRTRRIYEESRIMVKVKCPWCLELTEIDSSKGPYGYGSSFCSKCGRSIPSSKKESTGNVIGKKHIHRSYKRGETAC